MMKLSALLSSVVLLCALSSLTAQAQSAQLPSILPAFTMQVSAQANEAKQLLRANSAPSEDYVTLAALDPETSQIYLFSLSKEFFLKKDAQLSVSSSGHQAEVKIVRANGVNTAVTITDAATQQQLLPLVVEYPIVKGGKLTETAFYTSAHPALLSDELINAGKTYVRAGLDLAAERLAAQGEQIDPAIVDVAEHLCIVEHTDHKRFMTEDRRALFQEILSLYALNQPDTFRYSVSTAGAGGMIQMIPQTYEAIRQSHPRAQLNPDFVSGMRNHSNALEAMLLYMQDTWNYLARSSEVQDALRTGIATQEQLLAAGYNSNPARLPSYLKRGGAGWRALIPAETQMYLAIYGSLDSLIKLKGRSTDNLVANSNSSMTSLGTALSGQNRSASGLIPWIANHLLASSSLIRYALP